MADGVARNCETCPAPVWLSPKPRLQELIDELRRRGYEVVGPTVAEEAIVYDVLERIDQLPRGVVDEQAPGFYRLHRTQDDRWFDFVVGPHSWKKYLFPPRLLLSTAAANGRGWRFETAPDDPPRRAFLGVRACELAAIRVQDRVMLEGPFVDPAYQRRRERMFVVAVHCARSGENCFCVSMQTGPRCAGGYDLALTETDDGFVVDIGTQAGADVIAACRAPAAAEAQQAAADATQQAAAEHQTKRMPAADLPRLLMENLQHPRWEAVGARCLSCTNCTLVCPTCFCCSVEEVSQLETGRIERQRHWDSCFHAEFSALNGTPVRNDVASRYRQWLTHKLATWHDQFGTSGCVGCGRCITWCPVGIDITEEASALLRPAGLDDGSLGREG